MRMRPCPCLLLLLLLCVSLCPSAEARKEDSEGRVSSAARAAATAVKSAAAKVSSASRGVAAKVSDQARSAVARVTNKNTSSSTTASDGGAKPSKLDKIKSKAKDAIKKIDKEKAGKVAKKGAKFAKKVPWWGWLLIVVVVIALGFAGWYIYSR